MATPLNDCILQRDSLFLLLLTKTPGHHHSKEMKLDTFAADGIIQKKFILRCVSARLLQCFLIVTLIFSECAAVSLAALITAYTTWRDVTFTVRGRAMPLRVLLALQLHVHCSDLTRVIVRIQEFRVVLICSCRSEQRLQNFIRFVKRLTLSRSFAVDL